MEQQKEQQLSVSLPSLKTLEIPEFDNKPIVPPSINKNRQHSWTQVDTSNFKYRRLSLQPEYQKIYSNRYNKEKRQSSIYLNQIEVEKPQQSIRSYGKQYYTDIFSGEIDKPKYQRRQSPDIFSKETTWETRKFNKRVVKDQIKDQTGEYQYVSNRRKAPDFVRTSLTDSLADTLQTQQNPKVEIQYKPRKYIPRDNKELFMPFDSQYGLPECKGWTKGYSKPSSAKIQNRSGDDVDRMIQEFANEEGYGIKSGLQLESSI